MIGLIVIVAIILLINRKNKLEIIHKKIKIKHLDVSLQSIQFIWIPNIGDIPFKLSEIEKVCNPNTLILLSGYSKKKSKKYKDENIQYLSTIAPVYFLWNDVDYSGNYRDLNALLLDCKVTILENKSASFETENGTKFSIIGLDDVKTKRDQLDFALEERYEDDFSILSSYTEVMDSNSSNFESIQVYLFERSQLNVNRNQKMVYLELHNNKGIRKQNTITVLNFEVMK
ncbi:hypothetical protein COE53_15805 [Bacillus sp. AFS029533]|uniref:Uncharacterized protein n=1 Tax=Gottfriedia luciferensis TaxID=178774 RepID=A0ABX2ZWU3_9BACI|nr:hypothetical protein BED47_00340 [Gottfriedia luciferensis]PGZ91090.1 hypothetical protein COE53_15805 [Bacillus sp. AFS029533]